MTERLEARSPPDSIRDLDAGRWNPKEILGDLDLVRPIPTVILLFMKQWSEWPRSGR